MPYVIRALAVASAACLLSACIAQRTVSSLAVPPGAVAQLEGLRFRVMAVEPAGVGSSPQALQSRLSAAYPRLFVDDPVAIPLVLRLEGKYEQHFAGAVLTGLTLGIVPWPVSYGTRNEVGVTPWSAQGAVMPESSVRYAVMRHEWATMLTPLGLIPIPGRSDIPRRSAILMDEAGMTAYERRRTEFQAAEQGRAVVAALSALNRGKLRQLQAQREALPVLAADIDGHRYHVRLVPAFSGSFRQEGGADLYLLDMRLADAPAGQVVVHTPTVARRGQDGRWQILRTYLPFASRPTVASVLLEGGVPARPVVLPVESPALADFIERPLAGDREVAALVRWSNGILLQIKNSSLPAELAVKPVSELQQLTTTLEATLLDLNERVSRANDRAQQAVEKGENPDAWRELAMVYRQRSEILKAILGMVRQEAAARGHP